MMVNFVNTIFLPNTQSEEDLEKDNGGIGLEEDYGESPDMGNSYEEMAGEEDSAGLQDDDCTVLQDDEDCAGSQDDEDYAGLQDDDDDDFGQLKDIEDLREEDAEISSVPSISDLLVRLFLGDY